MGMGLGLLLIFLTLRGWSCESFWKNPGIIRLGLMMRPAPERGSGEVDRVLVPARWIGGRRYQQARVVRECPPERRPSRAERKRERKEREKTP